MPALSLPQGLKGHKLQGRQQQQQQEGTNNHCGPVLLFCFYPIVQTKTVAPCVVLPPPPWNNQSAIPFLCFFLFLQTKTVTPSVVLTPPPPTTLLQTKTVAPCVVLTPPPFNNTSTKTTHKMMLNREPLTR